MSGLLEKISEIENLGEDQLVERKYSIERDLRSMLYKRKALIAVEGNIGLGKSTIIRNLENFGVRPFYELENLKNNGKGSIDIEDLLKKYYADMAQYAYQVQMEFFERRSGQLRKAYDILSSARSLEKEGLIAPNQIGSVGFDRTIYADRLVFTEVLHDNGNFPEWFYQKYIQYFDSEATRLPHPDLLIMLRSSTEFSLEMIRRRKREFEKEIDSGFIESLNRKMEGFEDKIRGYGFKGEVLVIDREQVNPVLKMTHYLAFLDEVREKLSQQ